MTNRLHCHFCGKPQGGAWGEVPKLIAGSYGVNGSVYICYECVGLCAELVGDCVDGITDSSETMRCDDGCTSAVPS